MKKIIFLFGFFVVLAIFSALHSCKKFGSSCGRNERFEDYKFFANTISGWIGTGFYYNEKIQTDSIYQYNILIFRISFSGHRYGCNYPVLDFFQSAYACSPPDLYSEEKITDIIITSDEDYDETHPAGTDLRNLFEVNSRSNGILNIDEYLSIQPNIEDVELKLLKAPETEKTFTFTVTYYFEGKLMKRLSEQLDPVTIKNI